MAGGLIMDHPNGGEMTSTKSEKAVELLTSECVASFEYTTGWDCRMFSEPIRLAISSTFNKLSGRDSFIERVLLELSEEESVEDE